MGLTINYTLNLPKGTKFSEIKAKLESLRQWCMDHPFESVDDHLTVLKGDDCNFNLYRKRCKEEGIEENGALVWMLLGARTSVYYTDDWTRGIKEAKLEQRSYYISDVYPKRFAAFSAWPGEGCESVEIGISEFPKTVVRTSQHKSVWDGEEFVPKKSRLKVHDSGWSWSAFCKTQYASNPECGGVPNFLRCHLLVIALLDKAKELGFNVEVRDEGDYYTKRDIEALIKEIGEWNEHIAGFVGALNDALGDNKGVSEISQYKNFEHLEANAQAKMTDEQRQVCKLIAETAKAIDKAEKEKALTKA